MACINQLCIRCIEYKLYIYIFYVYLLVQVILLSCHVNVNKIIDWKQPSTVSIVCLWWRKTEEMMEATSTMFMLLVVTLFLCSGANALKFYPGPIISVWSHILLLFHNLFLAYYVLLFIFLSQQPNCKCTSPLDGSCWPSHQQWDQLNSSVSGSLLSPLPPSYQCHVPYYDAEACAQISSVRYIICHYCSFPIK